MRNIDHVLSTMLRLDPFLTRCLKSLPPTIQVSGYFIDPKFFKTTSSLSQGTLFFCLQKLQQATPNLIRVNHILPLKSRKK